MGKVSLATLLVVVPIVVFLPGTNGLLNAFDVVNWCIGLGIVIREVGGTRWWASMDLKRKFDISLGRLPWSNRFPHLQKLYRNLFPSLNPSPFLLGYRFWSAYYQIGYHFVEREPSDELISAAVTPRYVWQPGPNVATCLAKHSAPGEGCMCGFWFRKSLWSAKFYRSQFSTGETVIGAVIGWGRCIEHSNGTRCEKAMVIALLNDGMLSEPHIQRVSEHYDVPVFDTPGKLKAYAKAYLKSETPRQEGDRK